MARALSETRCTSPGWSECLVSWLKRCLWTSWVTIPWRQNCCNLRWMWTWPSMRRCWTSFFFGGWGGQRWPIQPGDVVWTWVNLIFFGGNTWPTEPPAAAMVEYGSRSVERWDQVIQVILWNWTCFFLGDLCYQDCTTWFEWSSQIQDFGQLGSEIDPAGGVRLPLLIWTKSKELQHIALVQESKMRMLTFPRLPYIATAKGTEK